MENEGCYVFIPYVMPKPFPLLLVMTQIFHPTFSVTYNWFRFIA